MIVCVYVCTASLFVPAKKTVVYETPLCMYDKNIVTNSHFWEEHTVERMAYLSDIRSLCSRGGR